MADASDPHAPFMTSKWWPPACLATIAAWAGVTLYAGAVNPGTDEAGRYAFAAFGAVFFGLIFGYSIWHTRRTQREGFGALYDRLAITPVSARAVREAAAGAFRIGYLYFALGIIVTGLGLAAIALGGGPWVGRLLGAVVVIVVLWLAFSIYALGKMTQYSSDVFAPLGMSLVETPTLNVSIFHDIRTITGAMAYWGMRNGRSVTICHAGNQMVTTVSGPPAPAANGVSTPEQFAALTGESVRWWRGVTVATVDGDVVVTRDARDAGRFFLRDLLLAESLTGTLPPGAARLSR